MTSRISIAIFVICASTVVLSNLVAGVPAETVCPGPSKQYIGYRVVSVKLTSPLYFFSAANSPLNQLASQLPLKSGEPFDLVRYGEGASEITTAIRTGFADGLTAMRFVATVPRLENCTDSTVEVHYIVYTSVFPPLTGKSFEA